MTKNENEPQTSTSSSIVPTPASSAPATSQVNNTTMSKTQRVPPPENPEAVQTRFKVIAAFWAVIVFLGFPIWWKTTSVYRARLPFQEMVDWADGKVS